MSTLSRAKSMCFISHSSEPSIAAFNAAWFTMFSRSAPVKPVVPRANWSMSISEMLNEALLKTVYMVYNI